MSTATSILSDFSGEDEDSDEHGAPEDDVAVARPPRSGPASAELIVSGQAALDILDQLQSSGHVGRERASNLRRRFLLLKDTLENSRSTETSLLAQAKQLGQVLTQQQHVLEKGAAFPEGDSSELARLRQVLLAHSNQLQQSLQRQHTLNTQLASVEEEHAQVSRELDRLPRQADMEARLADLNRQLEDLRDEIRKRSKDIQHYNTEVVNREQRLSSIIHDTEELKSKEGALQDDLVQLRSLPGSLPREIDSIRKRYKDTKRQVAESESHIQNLSAQLEDLENYRVTLEGELKEAGVKLVETQEEGNRLHDLHRQAESSLTQAKERQVALLEQQASLELAVRHRDTEYSRLYETSASLARDNDRTAKQLKKVDLLSETAKHAQVQLQQRAEHLQSQTDEGEDSARERAERQQEIREDVEVLRKGLSMQNGVSSAQRAVLEEKQEEEEKVRARLASLTARLQQLSKEAVALTRQRDKDSRTCRQAKLSELGIQDSLCTQDAQLREQKKTLAHLQQQLADFAGAYKLIKTERNHTHSQIQKLQQLSSEMREKFRVLQNEAGVLTTCAQDKEKLLQKCDLVHSAKCMERDGQRQTASKLGLEVSQNKVELDVQRETLAKLTQEVSFLERQLNQLRKNYEHALQERNDAGLQLIERNEEVCVFHERLNMQEAVLREARLELMSREEEIRYLHMEIAQLQSHILVSRKRLPETSQLQTELVSAQIQLRACAEELRNLESRVENAQDPARVRLLPGPQEAQDDLCGHLEVLEERLAGLEQAGLEKELLYEQVCRLADRAKTRASTHRNSTLQVAQHVNQYQKKIKDTTQKTMALVSELTMLQASALGLKHEVREREGAVERAYLRLQTGQPPDEATEQQWQQFLREEQQRREASITKKLAVSEERQESTAEPRPNAYLPTGEGDLPLPKPYGSHAPFKPSEAGANMRHIRKPEPKPIDI